MGIKRRNENYINDIISTKSSPAFVSCHDKADYGINGIKASGKLGARPVQV